MRDVANPQRQIRDQSLQPRVLIAQLARLAHLAHLEVAVLRFMRIDEDRLPLLINCR
jgi:hypothetical protein